MGSLARDRGLTQKGGHSCEVNIDEHRGVRRRPFRQIVWVAKGDKRC